MGLSALFRKTKHESASADSEFSARPEDESNAVRGRSRRKRAQTNEPVDPALPEKKRARRRLVGAVALVMAAVIVLPMVLDSEPKPLADNIAVHIPSKDQPAVRPTDARPEAQQSGAPQMPAETGLDKNEELIQAPAEGAGKNAATPASEKAASASAATQDKKDIVLKPASGSDNQVGSQPASNKTPDDAERAKTILDGRAIAKADNAVEKHEAKPAAYVVQIAALASQENVTELQNKLKSAGIKSHTQKVTTASGSRIRVRAGPFPTKEEADQVRAKIGKLGLNSTLVPV